MNYCPYCGHSLYQMLIEGISSCSHCNRIFDSTIRNRLLSVAWAIRHHYFKSIEEIKFSNILTDKEAEFVEKYVLDEGYSHDEFLKVVDLFEDRKMTA